MSRHVGCVNHVIVWPIEKQAKIKVGVGDNYVISSDCSEQHLTILTRRYEKFTAPSFVSLFYGAYC